MKLSLGRRGAAVVAVGIGASLVLASMAAGGASVQEPDVQPEEAVGDIVADGSSTVGPYTTAAAELFRKAGA